MDWIQLAQEGAQVRAVDNMLVNLPINGEELIRLVRPGAVADPAAVTIIVLCK
jgi:hypothetical protein